MINPDTLKLVKPSANFAASYQEYIDELGDEERYPFPMDFDHSDFAVMLNKLADFEAGNNLPDGFVPSATYWLVCEDELIGVSNLRLTMNDALKHYGGHIGLGIRPQYRGQGLGNTLTELTIQEAIAQQISPIHIHCYKDNLASAQMIKRNGGKLDSEESLGEHVLQRYLVIPE